jgi:hypothetical protein
MSSIFDQERTFEDVLNDSFLPGQSMWRAWAVKEKDKSLYVHSFAIDFVKNKYELRVMHQKRIKVNNRYKLKTVVELLDDLLAIHVGNGDKDENGYYKSLLFLTKSNRMFFSKGRDIHANSQLQLRNNMFRIVQMSDNDITDDI